MRLLDGPQPGGLLGFVHYVGWLLADWIWMSFHNLREAVFAELARER